MVRLATLRVCTDWSKGPKSKLRIWTKSLHSRVRVVGQGREHKW